MSADKSFELCDFSRENTNIETYRSGADPGFQVRWAHLKNLRRAEGGANFFWVFRVKIHDFTPKKQITESPSLPLTSNSKNETVVSKLHCMSNL